jgi:hydrogenase maturation protease
VGYRNLSDHSFGVEVVEALAIRTWPRTVSVEDISYNPIAVVQRLQDEPPDRPFEVAVVISAAERPGRAPGTLSIYRWDNALPDAAGIQAAVAEAVTGVISLDNTLVVTRHFAALPAAVVVIEVEPRVHAFGATLSPDVTPAFHRACDAAAQLALNPSEALRLPVSALGGGAQARPRPASVQVQGVVSRG